MLNRYAMQIESPNHIQDNVFHKDLHKLWNSILRVTFQKELHKKELGNYYFKGMRENWFPLILLNLCDLLIQEGKNDEAETVIEYFKSLLNNSDYHSFYIDNGYVTNNQIVVFIRCKGEYRNYPILDILKYYNLNTFRIQEIKSQTNNS